jgi:hypothetical protein
MALAGLTDIFEILEPLLARIPRQWIPVLPSEYAQIIKGGVDHITVIRGRYRWSMR